jgi:hypothetical protein
MFRLLISLFCALAVAAKSVDLAKYSFEDYLQDFHLKFHPSELETRKAMFNAEVARVQAHNAKNLSWKEEINRFSVMTPKEKKVYHGYHKGKARAQKLNNVQSLPNNFEMKHVSALPKQVDWRSKGKVQSARSTI